MVGSLAGCSTYFTARVHTGDVPVMAARDALHRCLGEQRLRPCAEIASMRDCCARNAQSDPTLSDVWLGEWLTVTVGETGGAMSARILAANGHDPLAVESATKLEACVRREPPLVVELQRRTMFPDFR